MGELVDGFHDLLIFRCLGTRLRREEQQSPRRELGVSFGHNKVQESYGQEIRGVSKEFHSGNSLLDGRKSLNQSLRCQIAQISPNTKTL